MPDTVPLPPLRALVLEDEPLIQMDIEGLLTDAGYLVRSTSTRAAALALLDTEVFDVAVLDIGLPDGDGSVVASAFVARNIPFIFSSGKDAVPQGFEGVPLVEKPFRDGALLDALRSVLATR
jgi:DNA-binding response OmpR family regulator